jgi:multimeric flavodoxin WrbA
VRALNILIINGSPVNNGATAEIVSILAERLAAKHSVKTVCLGELDIGFCRGCRACHTMAKCGIQDDVAALLGMMDAAEHIVFVVPSYWGDFPGQLKAFVDRCTPYSNTHEPHARLKDGKKGYAIALRTGTNEKECRHIIEGIAHYYGHMDITMEQNFLLCGIQNRDDIAVRKAEIISYCDEWFEKV